MFHVLYDLKERYGVRGEWSLHSGVLYLNGGRVGHWRGLYDDKRRLMVMADSNSDTSDSWKWADEPEVSIPAWQFANRGRTFRAGQQGRLHMLRDSPHYVKLIENGMFDVKSMVKVTYPLERALEAVQAVADRTTVGTVVTFA